MFLANKLNKGAGAPAAPADAQFNYVTMLLHGDGTNGAQNNTFVDSSTNNFTITRNGNTTQGSFSPYGDNWGNYFAANSSSYITAPSSSSFSFTGDFTVECWLFVPSISQTIQRIFSSNAGPEGACFFSVGNNAGTNAGAGRLCAMGQLTSPYNTGLISSTSAIPTNTWVHAALVRSGSTVTIYQDGVSVASGTNSSTWNFNNGAGVRISGTPWDSNEYLNGYVSNLRVVKGTAVYTSTFTPSTTPLTAITNTVLLTCQSNRFKDNSSSPFTLTPAGDTSVQRFNPFGASTAYSTSVIGGSGYFDGSGDYLSTANSSAFAFGTGNFTLEFWYKGTDNSGGLGLVTGGSTGYWQLNLFSSTMYWQDAVGASNLLSVNAIPILNDSWNHVAVVRNSTTSTIYFNGVSVTSATDTTNYSGTGGDFRLGFDSNNNYIAGYIADYRIVKGTAVYTANFTPPTAPLTAVTNTQLLLNTTNGAIFDNAMMNDLETVGNAQISTSVVKYGTGSVKCTGDGNTTTTNSGYLLPNSSSSNLSAFGTGDFTIEFFLYLNSISGLRILLDFRGSTETAFPALYLNAGTLTYYVEADRITGSSLSTSTWYHIALSRSGTNTKLFVNGTQSGSTYTDSTNYLNASTRTPVIGANSYTGGGNVIGWYALDGNIDDLRITKGYARYTANFTAPTAALPDIGPN